MASNSHADSKSAFRGLVGEILGYYKDIAQQELTHWRNKQATESLWKHVYNTRLVKTIWQLEKAIDLMDFYHPSRIYSGKDRKTISCIDDFEGDDNLLIEGVAGQGKSIFLRYLCCTELAKCKRIPVFIELRRIQEGERLMSHIVDAFTTYGLEFNEEVFQVLAQSGRLVLLLDGFDETNEAVKKRLISDLETISTRFEALRIIVTSRPEGELRVSPHFRVVRISYLEGMEYEAVIHKLMGDSATKKNLLQSILQNKGGIQQTLNTPLLVTMLVVTYRSFQSIPEQLSDFYDSLFHLLLTRHDGTKPVYQRQRKCGLSDPECRKAFEALCYYSKAKTAQIFSEEELHQYAKKALAEVSPNAKESSFVSDLVSITCLMLKDGTEHRFIHKSVQEYYTASYIRKKPEQFAQKFYSAFAQTNIAASSIWEGELRFLDEIDAYRMGKYLIIPLLLKMFQETSYAAFTAKTNEELSAKMESVIGSMRMTFREASPGEWTLGGFFLPPGLGYFTHAFLGAFQSARPPVSSLQSISRLHAANVFSDPKVKKSGMTLEEWATCTGNEGAVRAFAEQFAKRIIVIAARVNKIITDAETIGLSELETMFPRLP